MFIEINLLTLGPAIAIIVVTTGPVFEVTLSSGSTFVTTSLRVDSYHVSHSETVYSTQGKAFCDVLGLTMPTNICEFDVHPRHIMIWKLNPRITCRTTVKGYTNNLCVVDIDTVPFLCLLEICTRALINYTHIHQGHAVCIFVMVNSLKKFTKNRKTVEEIWDI